MEGVGEGGQGARAERPTVHRTAVSAPRTNVEVGVLTYSGISYTEYANVVRVSVGLADAATARQ